MLFGCPKGAKINIFRGPHVRLIFDRQMTNVLLKNGPPNGPQKLLKIDRSVFWRGLKKRPQKWTLSRIRKSEILPLFTTL